MANSEQLEILKSGVDIWNKWRDENKSLQIDLMGADLRKVDLRYVNLSKADLTETSFMGADLTSANLSASNFNGVDFDDANLSNVDLSDAYLYRVSFCLANLSKANLGRAKLLHANITDTNFNKTDLCEANFSNAEANKTVFTSVNLGEAIGLEKVRHRDASVIGSDTFQLSKGKIPEKFLRGCGLPDWEIESAKLHNPDLTNEEIVKIQYRIYDLRATQAIQISPLFISYSHADSTFVDTIETGLNEKGVRFWRDIHDMTVGRIETQIDRAIRQNPTVLLILSKNSLNSDWVQLEVRKARDLEKELGHDTLCPIALDDGWKSSRWPQRIMDQVMEYNVLDFSGWEDKTTFDSKFAKLLSGLDLFYKKPKT